MHVFARMKFMRQLFHLLENLPWWLAALVAVSHFLITWGSMAYFEGDTTLVRADTYWWYYMVTSTTVGYGDFFPVTLGGRITAAVVMIFGIAMIGAFLGKIATLAVDFAEQRRKGMAQLKLSGHTIVIGDNSLRTLELLRNLIADEAQGDVVLIANRGENPLNGKLAGFVCGEIDEDDVQERACFDTARNIIVLAPTDDEVVGRAVAVIDGAPATTEIVVFFQRRLQAKRFNLQTEERVRCVTSVDMSVVVQESQDPGAADFVDRLMDNEADETYMRLTVPEGVQTTFMDLAVFLMKQRVNPFGLYREKVAEICPDPQTPVKSGDVVAVGAKGRSHLNSLDWASLKSQTVAA